MDKTKIVQSLIAYVEQQLKQGGESLSLDAIAEKMGYSKFYLSRIFQNETQMTIHQYISRRRLTEAADKLAHTDKSIADIAYETGYQSQQAFTNAFRQIYQCAPLRYRQSGPYAPVRKTSQMHRIRHFYSHLRMAVAA